MKLFVALALVVTACGATSSGARFDITPPAAAPEVTPARASSPEVGVVLMLSDAIANLQLSKDQNAQVAALVHDLQEGHRRIEEVRKQLSLDVASSVEAGTIDDKGLRADAEGLGRARAESAPNDAKALEELHRILTPDQRKQFSAALAARADKLPSDDAQTRYGNWRSDLEISLEQNEKIEPKLDADGSLATSAHAERDAWRRRLHATAADFANDTYSANAYADPDVVATTVERVRRLVGFMNVVVPLLTPEQRKTAASNLRAEVGVQP
ncbi:MAG TPA: Spy/CpxP family protein refolding chaperone [Polyangiaceae bacterium]|jgi:Spy/CpxP family protein refolding chaperone